MGRPGPCFDKFRSDGSGATGRPRSEAMIPARGAVSGAAASHAASAQPRAARL